jgi:hypothetical protein
MLCTPAIWAYQLFHWLRWGTWQGISASDAFEWAGIGEPSFEWVGIQKVSDFIMRQPFSLVWFFLMVGLVWSFAAWADRTEKEHHIGNP